MQCLKKLRCALNKSQHIIHKRNEFHILGNICQCKDGASTIYEAHEENEEEKNIYSELSNEYLGSVIGGNNVYVIQPYIKWGFDKKKNTTPQLQLQEATTLIKTLSDWNVVGARLVPLLTLKKQQLVGSGALVTLQTEIRNCSPDVTAIFISTNLLKFVQIAKLQKAFNLPIYDRYSIVIHIFREHAKSPEAKLQVAIAELPYIKQKMIDFTQYSIGRTKLNEKTKFLLQARERKLKNALQKLKEHRHMIKQQRQRYGFPTIAVVGYTNAGKTCLIKALSRDESLNPENKLFATLDTTVHMGLLPNRLKVLFVDTIGFIQDVPETLIEPFKITLEDAINANILIHVFDISHPDIKAQILHVQDTLKSMVDEDKVIINAANKCDLAKEDMIESDILPEGTFVISAITMTGIELLRSKIQKAIMKAANIVKLRIKARTGSAEASWLYKETTVLSAEPDSTNVQLLIMDVLMTTPVFYNFKRTFKI